MSTINSQTCRAFLNQGTPAALLMVLEARVSGGNLQGSQNHQIAATYGGKRFPRLLLGCDKMDTHGFSHHKVTCGDAPR